MTLVRIVTWGALIWFTSGWGNSWDFLPASPEAGSFFFVLFWWVSRTYCVYDSGVVSNIFYFHPYLGKWSILTDIFQMGWNRQLDDHVVICNRVFHCRFSFLRKAGWCWCLPWLLCCSGLACGDVAWMSGKVSALVIYGSLNMKCKVGMEHLM